MSVRAMIVGQSHVHAIWEAARADPALADQVLVRRVGKEASAGETAPFRALGDAAAEIAALPPGTPTGVSIMGAAHSRISLLAGAELYDFAAHDGDPLDPGAVPVPRRQIVDWLAAIIADAAPTFDELVRGAPGPVHVLPPPPPKGDEAFLNDIFARKGNPPRVPTAIRLKMWKLEQSMMVDWAAARGHQLLLPPAETLDADGYLKPAYYAADATHANAEYGAAVLGTILKSPA